MAVIKVGGSVLRDAAAYEQVAKRLIEESRRAPTWAVVSAAHGITERLLAREGPEYLLHHHEALAAAPLPGTLARLLHQAQSPHAHPHALPAWGEQASIEVLRTWVARHGGAAPIVELCPRTRPPTARLRLVPGFYHRRADGSVRLLPRGGSDLAAVWLAVRHRQRQVRYWKDTGAVLDPEGRPMPSVAANELLRIIGPTTKPLHPAAVLLARRHGITLRVEGVQGGQRTRILAR